MKGRLLFCTVVALLGGAVATTIAAEQPVAGAGDTVAAAIQRQVASGEALRAQMLEAQDALRKWYGAALEAVKKDAMSRGQLDGVLAADQERDRLDRDLTPEEESKLPAVARTVRKQYDQAREKLAAQQKAAQTASLREYAVTLDTLEKRLTQKGDIDGALAARKERGAAQEQLAALETNRPPAPAAATPPAAAKPPVAAASSPPPAGAKEQNTLVKNGSFEDGQNGWKFQTWTKMATVKVDTAEKHQGQASLCIENAAGDDSAVTQKVTVKPMTRYRLHGYIKTKGVEMEKGNTGANLCLQGAFQRTEALVGTRGWTKVSLDFESGPLDAVTIMARLGFYSNMAKGTAWFDEIVVEEIGPSRKK
jgi:hypothetical protein